MGAKETFGDKLKQLRLSENLDQQQLAKAINISRVSIGYYESNKRTPDIVTLEKICKFFNVSANFLIGIDENKDISSNDISNYIGLSINSVNILKQYNELKNYLSPYCDLINIINLLITNSECDPFIEFINENPCIVRDKVDIENLNEENKKILDDKIQIWKGKKLNNILLKIVQYITTNNLDDQQFTMVLDKKTQNQISYSEISQNEVFETLMIKKIETDLKQIKAKYHSTCKR